MRNLAMADTSTDEANIDMVDATTATNTDSVMDCMPSAFADALQQPAQEITPSSPTETQIVAEVRAIDADARKELEVRGGLPCYPASVELPITSGSLQEPQLSAAMLFQECSSRVSPLCSQLSHWRMFQGDQKLHRDISMEHELMEDYLKESARRIQKRHQGSMHPRHYSLLIDHTQQTMLRNWSEFLEWEFRRTETTESYPNKTEEECKKNKEDRARLTNWIEWEWCRLAALEVPQNQEPQTSDGEVSLTDAYIREGHSLCRRRRTGVAAAKERREKAVIKRKLRDRVARDRIARVRPFGGFKPSPRSVQVSQATNTERISEWLQKLQVEARLGDT